MFVSGGKWFWLGLQQRVGTGTGCIGVLVYWCDMFTST